MSSSVLPSRRDGVNYLYMLAAFVVIVAGMKAAESILNPLLLAVFLSVICAPAYLGLLRRGISQWLALLIVAGTLSIIVVVLLAVVMQSITSFTRNQEHYQEQIPRRLNQLKDDVVSWLPAGILERQQVETGDDSSASNADSSEEELSDDESSDEKPADEKPADDATDSEVTGSDTTESDGASADPPADDSPTAEDDAAAEGDSSELEQSSAEDAESDAAKKAAPADEPVSFMDQLYDQIQEQLNPGTVLSLAGRLAGSLGKLLSNALLIMLTVVFILLEVGSFREKLSRAFSRSIEPTRQAEQMVHSMQRYMAIKTAVSLATAMLIGLWLRVFDVPYIALWMLIAFLLNFIPNIGSIIAAVPAVIIAWLEFGVGPALGCAVGYVVVNVAVGNFLEPRLMGRDLGLSPLVIFCSMVFWGWVLGPVGMLLSVPLTMAVHIVLSGFDDTRWIATLMGGRASD